MSKFMFIVGFFNILPIKSNYFAALDLDKFLTYDNSFSSPKAGIFIYVFTFLIGNSSFGSNGEKIF
jgi:hypothetical protein